MKINLHDIRKEALMKMVSASVHVAAQLQLPSLTRS